VLHPARLDLRDGGDVAYGVPGATLEGSRVAGVEDRDGERQAGEGDKRQADADADEEVLP